MTGSRSRIGLCVGFAVLLAAALVMIVGHSTEAHRVHATAYFDTANGIYPGDQVRILGVPVGKVTDIQAQPTRVAVRFWFDSKYPVPAQANAVIMSPAVVSARIIQLTPAYTSGPVLGNGAVIPQARTLVPVEWDDLQRQLASLTASLQPDKPGGVAPLGAAINTAADNLRGRGADIRDAVVKLSEALSALGDHRTDIFSTIKNLSLLVTALQSSSSVLAELNRNLAAATNLLANDPGEVGRAIADLNVAVRDIDGFISRNREPVGIALDKLASTTQSVVSSLTDIKQVLHVAPNSLANFTNVYYPATGSLTGGNIFPHFANPLQFICSGVEAASRLNHEQSAKLCVQYLAPIFKNRQYNFPPLGATLGPFTALLPVVGAKARPNEITYSEDRLRPDNRTAPTDPASAPDSPAPGSAAAPPPAAGANLSAAGPRPGNLSAGLAGMMLPPGPTP